MYQIYVCWANQEAASGLDVAHRPPFECDKVGYSGQCCTLLTDLNRNEFNN